MLKGSIVSIITPMDEKGNICQSSLKKLINYHISSGSSAIVSVGTTGESATLNQNEHVDIVKLTLELADNQIPVIAGIGENATAEAISLIERFNDSGVFGYLVVTPYYNCPTQEGLYQHFRSIAHHTNLPQILYNIPSRTGCDMQPETIKRLAKVNNIIGIKEATGKLARVHQIKDLVSNEFILLSGDDSSALDFMQLGGHGVISVTANVAAEDMAKMCKLAMEGHFDEARVMNRRLMPLHKKLFLESNPIPVKWACKKLGLIKNDTLRLPMTPITSHARQEVMRALKYAHLL